MFPRLLRILEEGRILGTSADLWGGQLRYLWRVIYGERVKGVFSKVGENF